MVSCVSIILLLEGTLQMFYLAAECLPDGVLHAVEMALFGILYGSWSVFKQVITFF
jgi:hypothetical protein